MKSVMATGVAGVVALAPLLCGVCGAADTRGPEKAAKPAVANAPSAAKAESGKKVYHSADFGWTANQDVTEQFTALLESGKLKAGDELVLDHTYRTTGGHKLPAHFTLSAVKGAGFDVPLKPVHGALLELADGSALRNLTINYLDTPPLGGTGIKHGVNFADRVGVVARGKNDLVIENCALIGSITHHLALVDCSRPKVIGCHIAGGFWTICLTGVTDPVFRQCLIEKCQGDGIKTCPAGRDVVRGVLVENCVFQDNGRDGIDTTGGFNDSVVRNTIFRRLRVCGMDIKSCYQSKTGQIADVSPQNVGIRVENCLFHDMPNAIVLTTVDCGCEKGPGSELLSAANIKAYAPHDIDVNDCVVGHAEKPPRSAREGGYGVLTPTQEGEHMRVFLLKDAYAIRYRNVRFSGDRIMPVCVRSLGGSHYLSAEAAKAIDHSITGNVLTEPAPPIEPGVTEAPFACGPQPR